MGLCKCPKRKVTNQFCFEHRVNVCEHCMVQKHPKCVVQSYLQWLQDSDYNPNCEFCHRDLANENCVRLSCYHVFHWVCLDKYARQLPPNTAPAGYACPVCHECLFPPENQQGPVAETLRGILNEVNWARAGLGMPLLEERTEKRPEFASVQNGPRPNGPNGPRPPPEGENDVVSSVAKENVGVHAPSADRGGPGSSSSSSGQGGGGGGGERIVSFDIPTNRISKDKFANNETLMTSPLLRDPDHDDNKYKRKSGLDMLVRWCKNILGPSARRRSSKVQRYLMIAVIVVIAFLTLAAVFSYLSSASDFSDPMLEPLNNPNIRVGD